MSTDVCPKCGKTNLIEHLVSDMQEDGEVDNLVQVTCQDCGESIL